MDFMEERLLLGVIVLSTEKIACIWNNYSGSATSRYKNNSRELTKNLVFNCLLRVIVVEKASCPADSSMHNPLNFRFGRRCPPRVLTYELNQFCRVAGASRLAGTQQTHCGMHIFSHTQMTTRAGSLVYVRVESGCDPSSTTGNKQTLPIISSSFWMAVGLKGLTDARCLTLNMLELTDIKRWWWKSLIRDSFILQHKCLFRWSYHLDQVFWINVWFESCVIYFTCFWNLSFS